MAGTSLARRTFLASFVGGERGGLTRHDEGPGRAGARGAPGYYRPGRRARAATGSRAAALRPPVAGQRIHGPAGRPGLHARLDRRLFWLRYGGRAAEDRQDDESGDVRGDAVQRAPLIAANASGRAERDGGDRLEQSRRPVLPSGGGNA